MSDVIAVVEGVVGNKADAAAVVVVAGVLVGDGTAIANASVRRMSECARCAYLTFR